MSALHTRNLSPPHRHRLARTHRPNLPIPYSKMLYGRSQCFITLRSVRSCARIPIVFSGARKAVSRLRNKESRTPRHTHTTLWSWWSLRLFCCPEPIGRCIEWVCWAERKTERKMVWTVWYGMEATVSPWPRRYGQSACHTLSQPFFWSSK